MLSINVHHHMRAKITFAFAAQFHLRIAHLHAANSCQLHQPNWAKPNSARSMPHAAQCFSNAMSPILPDRCPLRPNVFPMQRDRFPPTQQREPALSHSSARVHTFSVASPLSQPLGFSIHTWFTPSIVAVRVQLVSVFLSSFFLSRR